MTDNARSSEPQERRPVSPREKALLAFCAVALVTAAVFASSLSHDFVTWDDNLHVYKNPWLSPVTIAHVAHFWRHSYGDLYIPVSYTLFSGLAAIASCSRPDPTITDTGALFDPHVFHAADLALHVASTLIVFALLRRLVRNALPAACGALLFAIHPLQVESVAWVAETRGVLAGLFCVIAAWLYVARIEALRETGRMRLDIFSWAGLVVLTVLALLSKPSAVMIPALLFAIAYGLRLRSARDAAIDVAPLLLAALPIVVLTHSVQHPAAFSITPPLARPLVAGDALAFYLAKLVAPIGLIPDYARTPHAVLGHWWGYVTWLAPAFAAAAAYRFRNNARYLAAGLGTFAAALLPVLGLVPFGYQAYSTVADRYAYLALLGPAVALAYALAAYPSKPAFAATGIVLAILCVLNVQQTARWANSRTLYAYTIGVNPNTAPIQHNAGELLMRDNPLAAEPYFRAAIRANPLFPNEHINLGSVLEESGRPREALEQFVYAARLDNSDPSIPYDIGNTLMVMGEYAKAIQAYDNAIKLKPSHAGALNNEGRAYLALGEYALAALRFQQAARVRPAEPGFHINAALALARCGRKADALIEIKEALRIDPDNALAQNALNDIRTNAGPIRPKN